MALPLESTASCLLMIFWCGRVPRRSAARGRCDACLVQ
jgi:hypothetical protein